MRKILTKVLAISLVAIMALTPLAASAQESEQPLEATIQLALEQAPALMEALSVAGMTVAVVDVDNDFTWLQGFGYVNAETQTAVTETTLFNIGSTAKLFTAVAIMQLVEDGILDLDEPIVTYLPEFSMLPHPVFGGNYRNITARMLLTHVSGAHEYQGPGFVSTEGQDREALNTLLAILSQMHMQNAEVNRMTYNNTGYTLLGILVAALTGADNYFDGFVDYTEENIFVPAGMVSSSFAIDDSNRANVARPHDDATTVSEFFVYVNSTQAGGMVSNAVDMARFMHIMLGGGAYGDDESSRILSRETVREMVQIQDFGIRFPTFGPSNMQMGLGFMHLALPDGVVKVGHGGNLQHHTDFILDFDNGIGVFVSVNGTLGSQSAAAPPMVAELIWRSAVQEKTGQPLVPSADMERTAFVPTNQDEILGFYTLAGRLVASDDGTLSFTGLPGLDLTPADDGTFDTVAGSIWFSQVNGIVFAHLEDELLGERIEASPADESFLRWVGEYHFLEEGVATATMTLTVSDDGYATLTQEGMTFLLEKVDEYTYFFPGRVRIFGAVVQFSDDGDTVTMRYSNQTLIRVDADQAVAEGEHEIELRFVIGSVQYTLNGDTYQVDTAPFIDFDYNRTMVPLRAIAEIFGAEVDWIAETRTATILMCDVSIAISADEPLAGGMGIAHNVQERVFVPVAYIAQMLGAEIIWDGANQAVYIFG